MLHPIVRWVAISCYNARLILPPFLTSTRLGRADEASVAPELPFMWQELGGPPVKVPDGRRGFGTELLEQTLAYDLKAETTLDFDPTGFRCTIKLILTEAIALSESY